MKTGKILSLDYHCFMGGGQSKVVFLIIIALGVFAVNNTAGYKQRLADRKNNNSSKQVKANNNSKKNSNKQQSKNNQSSNNQSNKPATNNNPSPGQPGLPNKLYGLTNNGNGKWVYNNGQIAYDQARVYAGAGINDGKYPQAPVKKTADCTYQADKIVQVKVDSNKYPASALHFYLAFRRGAPQVVSVGDKGANIRSVSLAGIPTKPGLDRDEVNLNATWEAQYDAAQAKKKAEASGDKVIGTSDIAWIPLSDNRGSGSSIGSQISDYCTGQKFKINLVPSV
jgi:hypothetical protein